MPQAQVLKSLCTSKNKIDEFLFRAPTIVMIKSLLSNVYEIHSRRHADTLLVAMMTVNLSLAILERRNAILLRSRHRAVAPRGRSIVETLDVSTPLVLIRPQHASVVSQQAVDFAFDVGGLRPDSA